MPQIETWSRLPAAVRAHLVERMRDSKISPEDTSRRACRETAAEHLRMIFMRAGTRGPFRQLKTGLGKCLWCPKRHFFAPASPTTIGSDVPRRLRRNVCRSPSFCRG